MRIVQGLDSYPADTPASAVALGVFDGVHLGHREILGVSVSQARQAGLVAVACTFDPHPLEVLRPGWRASVLTPLGERLELIATTGIDTTVVIEFTPDFAALEPEVFVGDVLVRRLRARHVVVGFNHRFGRGARGDAALLRDLGSRYGFVAQVVPPLTVDGETVSSSGIRAALQRGDVEQAARWLGRAYALSGEVVHGAGRGQAIGFPTANIRVDRPLPLSPGVYACRVDVSGGNHRAVVNVGVRPTFGESELAVEAHLLDFTGDLYGQRIRFVFLRRIRDERKFPSVDELRRQIEADVASARGQA